MSDYTPTGAPADQTRGASATIRSEFQAVATAIATKADTAGETYSGTHDFTGATLIAPGKADVAGETYSGTHDFTGATISVSTQASSDTSTKSASTEFVQTVVMMAGINPIAHQIATQAEMEAGTESALRLMSPLRVKQAIDAAGVLFEAAQTFATQAEMEAGSEEELRSMSPLRVWQAIEARASLPGHAHPGVHEPVQTFATQAEMEAGSEEELRSMSPLRVKQAIDAAGVLVVAYDDRASLRTLSARNDVIVESIGLLRYYVGSTEIDDDETCFATSTGRWLLECPHWDMVEALQITEDDARNADIEDLEADLAAAQADLASAQTELATTEAARAELAARWPGRVLRATQSCSITSVASLAQSSFTATVTGAATGDAVIATPPDALNARLSVFARVTAADTVTIYLNNPSASTATIATGTWAVTVISAT